MASPGPCAAHCARVLDPRPRCIIACNLCIITITIPPSYPAHRLGLTASTTTLFLDSLHIPIHSSTINNGWTDDTPPTILSAYQRLLFSNTARTTLRHVGAPPPAPIPLGNDSSGRGARCRARTNSYSHHPFSHRSACNLSSFSFPSAAAFLFASLI